MVNSVNDGPYAARTRLGWIVNGPLKESTARQQRGKPCKVSANCISVTRLDDLVDFSEKGRDEALTPNHLLLLKGKPALPPGLFDRDDLYTLQC